MYGCGCVAVWLWLWLWLCECVDVSPCTPCVVCVHDTMHCVAVVVVNE